MNKPIGVFDSGIGGLTVLDNLRKLLPNESYIYIGDNLHCPYGEKTKEQLLEYSINITNYFINKGVSIIVLACNTTSANVLDQLQLLYPFITFIGVIDATVQKTINSNISECLVIATKATIDSNKYQCSLSSFIEKVHALATPNLVNYVEQGVSGDIVLNYLDEVLKDYKKVESIILGCTHYPILSNSIKRILPTTLQISSSEAICNVVEKHLIDHKLCSIQSGDILIYTTGCVKEFKDSSKAFFNYGDLEINFLEIDGN